MRRALESKDIRTYNRLANDRDLESRKTGPAARGSSRKAAQAGDWKLYRERKNQEDLARFRKMGR